MKGILNDIAVSVGLSKEQYQRVEAANTRRFQGH